MGIGVGKHFVSNPGEIDPVQVAGAKERGGKSDQVNGNSADFFGGRNLEEADSPSGAFEFFMGYSRRL